MVTLVGYSVAGRSEGRVMPCAVCTIHMEMRSAGFLVEPQNQGRQFCACGGFLNLLIHFMSILARGYLLVIMLWSLCEDSLLFCKSCHNGVHDCLNTCLYAL
jgi:hypothetical protein